ncbi:MAG: DUF58 domain-containing protein [Ktedonobacteraceae bacterium]|nr:DUF58 domain-containing protein [Ktedonobacteraceae bacterium]
MRFLLQYTTRSAVIGGEHTYRRWYLLGFVLVIASIFWHIVLLFICGMLLLLILGTIDLWAYYCLHALGYRRHLSEQRVSFGETITLSLSVENAKPLPLPWLEVVDTVPRSLPIEGRAVRSLLPGDQSMLQALFSPRWYERVTRHYAVYCNMRGVHTFGPATIRSGDLFGFVRRETQVANAQYVLVYPLIVPLTHFGLPAHHPFGERRAPRRLLEDPSRVVGMRDYLPGDSLRRVHWKATARVMKLQSKVYEATTTYTLVLFLNIASSLDMYYGIHPEIHELSISAAASVTNWALAQGYAVGLYANTLMYMPDEKVVEQVTGEEDIAMTLAGQLKRRRIHIPPASDPGQLTRILEVLARIQTYFGSTIEDVLAAERSRLPAGATVVVISSGISEQLVETLIRLRQNGHAVAILFVGENPPPLKLGGIPVYHLGGEATWQQLMTGYCRERPGEAHEKMPTAGVAGGFNL